MNNSGVKILIVEDSALQAEMLKRMLNAEGFSVIVANDGAEGLTKAKKLKPDLVISDINMPVMNGFDLCRFLKNDKDTLGISVILLTSLSVPNDVVSALESGADNFIVKPYDRKLLLSRIDNIFLNRELQKHSQSQTGVEIHFAGKKYIITSEKKQILDLLISTYENAVHKNTELIEVQKKLEILNEELEQKVLKVQILNEELNLRRLEAEDARNLAESASKIKTEFLANMSHGLRTPLNSINGFSEVLSDETFGPLNDKQKKYINNVLTSGKHLLLLINQILDMAKVESGKMKLTLTVLPIKNLLYEISLLVEDMINKKNLQMILEIDDDLPDIDGDDLKIKEIIYNLISNAVKFTMEGGKIGIRAKRSGSVVEVEVWDNGIGIAEENKEKIFEGFFRVDTPYSRITEGTGLGLPLARKLVELHGGILTVESEGLSKGTLVRFTLPIKAERE
jgi:signal transduction histidine kinase